MTILQIWDPVAKEYVTAKAGPDGGVLTEAVGGGGGGGDASAANQDEQTAVLEAIRDKIPASPAQDRTTATAPSATRASNGSAFIDVALDATVAAVTTAVNAAKAVLDTIYTRLADGNQVAVVRGNVADNSPAALPVTIGGEDTGGKSWPIVGANVGSGLQPFVQVTNNVAVQTPAGGTVATEATLSALNNKVLTATADPATTDAGVRVRQVPAFTAGKQIHVQTSVGIANAANKLLFGFYNNTGATVYVGRIHASNTQTANIAGVLCQLNVQVSNGAITGGTTIDSGSSPALVAACRDIRNAVPATLVFNTGGALAGTPSTIESVRWSTDETAPNGTGVANEMLSLGSVMDLWDFCDDPIVIPTGYSCAVVCDAAATNGTTLVDFNIYRT